MVNGARWQTQILYIYPQRACLPWHATPLSLASINTAHAGRGSQSGLAGCASGCGLCVFSLIVVLYSSTALRKVKRTHVDIKRVPKLIESRWGSREGYSAVPCAAGLREGRIHLASCSRSRSSSYTGYTHIYEVMYIYNIGEYVLELLALGLIQIHMGLQIQLTV